MELFQNSGKTGSTIQAVNFNRCQKLTGFPANHSVPFYAGVFACRFPKFQQLAKRYNPPVSKFFQYALVPHFQVNEILPFLALIQMERQDGGFFPSLREYNRLFGITRERLSALKHDVLIMHPGPINRGVEMESAVADGRHSVILQQVTYGVAVRMALIYLLSGGEAAIE